MEKPTSFSLRLVQFTRQLYEDHCKSYYVKGYEKKYYLIRSIRTNQTGLNFFKLFFYYGCQRVVAFVPRQWLKLTLNPVRPKRKVLHNRKIIFKLKLYNLNNVYDHRIRTFPRSKISFALRSDNNDEWNTPCRSGILLPKL